MTSSLTSLSLMRRRSRQPLKRLLSGWMTIKLQIKRIMKKSLKSWRLFATPSSLLSIRGPVDRQDVVNQMTVMMMGMTSFKHATASTTCHHCCHNVRCGVQSLDRPIVCIIQFYGKSSF
ncbi:hypothetical protein Nepgr_021603 [Nepenthes gracilis]|uniref:Uncharacterized protein n=1 Tax=Nepenthes gracilis TaxID=150966 RepID=A0AAD3SZ23_NEPGR|nr:hypothetical protein Nepgr_021603 [Nepenthes gracilis]